MLSKRRSYLALQDPSFNQFYFKEYAYTVTCGVEIGIFDLYFKTPLNCYYSFIKIIITKTLTIHDIILS